MKKRIFLHILFFNVLISGTLSSYGQKTQSLQVGIIAYVSNNRFCSGSPEWFPLEAAVSGGVEPYYYQWTFSWNTDTLRTQTINIRPETSGEVKLKVTDSSKPPSPKEVKYKIYETIIDADFTFDNDTACAQTIVNFTSTASGGTPNYNYYWNFGDGYASNLKDPEHDFIASGCTGETNFNVRMRISDADGCYIDVYKPITVKNKPFLRFEDTENLYSPFRHCPEIMIDPTFDIVLANRSQDVSCITSYKIDWGDGNIQNNATFPIRHTYTEAGAFKLVITAENTSGCDLVWTQFVYNQSSPAVGIESFGGTEGCSPIEFTFGLVGYENNSIGTTYTWDFGDGSPPVEWNYDDPFIKDYITHVYENTSCTGEYSPGYFTTFVTVANGCDTKTATVDKIRVWSTPGASIDDGELTIDTICTNETIQLINNSTIGYYGTNCSSLAQYEWNFGNGITSTSAQMPATSWPVPGGYDIVLNVANPCGISRDTFRIAVIEPPVADASVFDPDGCAPFTPLIKNNSTGSDAYLWTITPDSGYTFINRTTKESKEPQIRFDQKGTYRLILYVSNACEKDTTFFDINVFAKPGGSIENIDDVCITDPVIHPSVIPIDNGSPITSYNWIFMGGTPTISTSRNPGEHYYPTAGKYIVNLYLQNQCGSSNLSDTFFVHPAPDARVKTPLSICESDNLIISGTDVRHSISYRWTSQGDGYFNDSTLMNPTYTPGSKDLTNLGTELLIIAEGESPCFPDTAKVTFSIQEKPIAKVDDDVTICKGEPYDLNNSTADHYDFIEWTSNGDGYFSDENILMPTYYPGEDDLSVGSVKLKLTANAIDPCTVNASDSMVITYVNEPTIDAGADQDICEAGQVRLNATGTGYSSVLWSIVSGEGRISNPTSSTTIFTLNSGFTGSQVVLAIEATGTYGCPNAYDTIVLTVIPRPIVIAGDDGNVCENGNYEVTGASVEESDKYYWKVNGDGTLNNDSVINPVYTPGKLDSDKGWVSLTLTAEGNSVCPNLFDDMIIAIQKLPVAIAGDDQDVCKTNDYPTKGSKNYGSTIKWTSFGSGNFEDDTELITTYYPSDADRDSGSVKLVLRVDAIGPCDEPDYDTVMLTFIDPPVVFAGNDTVICSSSFVPVNAWVLNSTQYTWDSNGTGTWINRNTLTPTYYPSSLDISRGSVILRLTSTNPACPPESDEMLLKLTAFPISNAGADDVICEDREKSLDDSYLANQSSMVWRTSGDGYFTDSTILHPKYIPGINDIERGSVKLYFIVTGLPPCNVPAVDSMTLSVQKNPVIYAGEDTIIGEGEEYTAINAQAQYVNRVSWERLGDGRFINSSSTISTYIPGNNDLKNKGVYLVLKGISISPCVQEVTDTIFVLITPKPQANAGMDENICEGSSITIATASAKEYSEIWWTKSGTGVLENDSTLNPTYYPSAQDIQNRKVTLTLHARGKDPIQHVVASDEMTVNIIHNAFTDVILLDTACENNSYQVRDVIYRDVNSIEWTPSGNGYFNGTGEEYPVYQFSSSDREKDTLYFYVQVSSIAPCVHVDHDTMMIRLYHEPEPLFDYDNPEGCAPLTVRFTNNSIGEELSYDWNFGNGLQSQQENPGAITFQQGRIADTTYAIRLEATNRCNTVSTSKNVIVKPIPITNFAMDVAWGCSPKEIRFLNITTGLADTYLWKWGDGKDHSSEEEPESHIFETGDYDTTYTITLVAENECGVDSMQKSVKIFPNTVEAFFETDTTIGCAPFEASFRNYSRGVLGDEPFLNWSWNFGDGNNSLDLNPVHIFTKPGRHTVTLYVNDTCSFGTFTTEIDVLGAPHAEFATDKTDYCEHDTVFVTPVNMPMDKIGGVAWDFGDTNLGFDFMDDHVYDTTGTFEIVLTATDIVNGCTSNTSKTITIHKAPVARFRIPGNDGCQPLQITFLNETEGGDYYAWDFGNGNRSIDVNGQQLFSEAGTFNITLKALDDQGCSDTIVQSLKVNPKPDAAFESSSLQTCFPPVDIEFTNLSNGADDYMWNFGNGINSKDTNPKITYTNYGDYDIRLIATNLHNCKDTSRMVYHVYHNPVADFTVDTTIGCDPFMVPFTNLSEYGLEYYWNFADQGYSEAKEPVYTFNGQGVYTVSLKVIGLGGCNDSIIKEDFIITNPSPTSYFEYSRINEIDTVQFHNFSSGAISYVWNFGDGESSEEENPWHRYRYYGMYNVSLTSVNEYNCKDIMVDSINFELFKGLFFPNAFSPGNMSEEVREFMVVGIGLVKYHLLIYDTWGNLIWETTALDRGVPSEAWDGTYKGQPLDPDVYVWHLKEAIFKDGSTYEGKRYGSITLIK